MIHLHCPPLTVFVCTLFWSICCVVAGAAPQDLGDYFGFEGVEIVAIDPNAGPMEVADINGDGLGDLVVVNNHKSRIEIHYQRANAKPGDERPADLRPNALPEHWRFRRETLTVSHRIGVIVPRDFDGDGLMDLIFAGVPSEVVFLRQASPGVFETARRHRVRDIMSNKDSLRVANVIGDETPELIAIAGGSVIVYAMNDANLDRAVTLTTGEPIVAIWVSDLDGNGQDDLVGAIPDASSPVRIWLGEGSPGDARLGPQLRFEMPAIVEVEPVKLSGHDAARLAVIERASRRTIIYGLDRRPIEQAGDRNASMRVYGFPDPGNRARDVVVYDVDNDGLLDLVATDTESSSIVVYRQQEGRGLSRGMSYPSFADAKAIAVDNIDDDGGAELFVLSESENVIGRTELGGERVAYPVPIAIPDGMTPVAMSVADLRGETQIAAILKEVRTYQVALIDMDGEITSIDLGSLSRAPDAIMPLDADQDGLRDLLILTEGKPMTMVRAVRDSDGVVGYEVKESNQMGQFGLVQAASTMNTSRYDIDEDGHDELLIADRNFIRAVRFESDPPAGVSPGWQVVEQINADLPSSRLVSVAVFPTKIIAADQENNRLVVFVRGTEGMWRAEESVYVTGFQFEEIFGGSFSGDGEENVLAVGRDGFSVIRLAGERLVLRDHGAWRSDHELHRQHELTGGDVNGDGFTDLVSLDAGEQMAEIFTFSETGEMRFATGFRVFESRIFSGGASREFEPSQALIADLTGDGANDLVLLAHDRVLLYPQSAHPE